MRRCAAGQVCQALVELGQLIHGIIAHLHPRMPSSEHLNKNPLDVSHGIHGLANGSANSPDEDQVESQADYLIQAEGLGAQVTQALNEVKLVL